MDSWLRVVKCNEGFGFISMMFGHFPSPLLHIKPFPTSILLNINALFLSKDSEIPNGVFRFKEEIKSNKD